MPFVKISPKERSNHGVTGTYVTVACYLGVGRSTDPSLSTRYVTIRVPLAIMQQWGIPIDGRRTMVFIHEGTGADTGFLMVVPDPHGYAMTQSKSKEEGGANTGFSVNIPLTKFNYYTPNECPVGATMTEHDITADGLLIACPDWFRPNIAKMEEDGLMPPLPEPPKPAVTVEEVERAIPPTLRGKKNAATAALDALAVVEQDPEETKAFMLNRQERRTLAKKVATTLGKR